MCNLSEDFYIGKKLKWISPQLWKQQTTTMTKFWYAVEIADYVMDVIHNNPKLRKVRDGMIVWTTEELIESDIGRSCHTRQNFDCEDFGQLCFNEDDCGKCYHYFDTLIEAPEASLIKYRLMQIGE